MKGLIFNGRHSSEFGLRMRSKDRSVLPSVREDYEYLPRRHGSIHFFQGLDDRMIEVEFFFIEKSLEAVRSKARKIAAWLFTKKRERLIFDDEPDKYYMAKVANQISLDQVMYAGVFTVIFRCEPFAYVDRTLVVTSPYTLHVEGAYETDVLISGVKERYSVDIGGEYQANVGNGENGGNGGNGGSGGSGGDVLIKLNGKTITIRNVDIFSIDTEKMRVVNGKNESLFDRVEGNLDEFKLHPGVNELIFSGVSSLTISYKERWL